VERARQPRTCSIAACFATWS